LNSVAVRHIDAVEIVIIGRAFYIRLVADLRNETFHGPPVGAIIHQYEMKAEL
jgi:hypothetical protein